MHVVEVIDSELSVGEISIFVGRNFILSIRNRSQHSFLGVRERCQREPELLRLGSGFVLYALMDAVVDRYFPVIDDLGIATGNDRGTLVRQGTALSNIEQLYASRARLSSSSTPLCR